MTSATKSKLYGRLWLGVVFLVLAGAHYFFYRFSFHELNPFPITKGLTFGLALWTNALIGAMWMRFAWARYILITLLVVTIVAFGMAVLMMNGQSVNPLPEPVHAALAGIGLYVVALIPLGASHALRRMLAPRQAGGQ